MKSLACILFLTVFTSGAGAQTDSTLYYEARMGQKRVLKTNPLPILWGNVILTSEYRLVGEAPVAPRQSIMCGLSYLDKGPFFDIVWQAIGAGLDSAQQALWNQLGKYARYNGYRIQGMYRFYLTRSHLAPRGFYAGPHVSFSVAKLSWEDAQYKSFWTRYKYFNVNLVSGVQGIIANAVAVDFFIGVGYKYNTEETHDFNGTTATVNITNIFKNPGARYTASDYIKYTLGLNFGYAF